METWSHVPPEIFCFKKTKGGFGLVEGGGVGLEKKKNPSACFPLLGVFSVFYTWFDPLFFAVRTRVVLVDARVGISTIWGMCSSFSGPMQRATLLSV